MMRGGKLFDLQRGGLVEVPGFCQRAFQTAVGAVFGPIDAEIEGDLLAWDRFQA